MICRRPRVHGSTRAGGKASPAGRRSGRSGRGDPARGRREGGQQHGGTEEHRHLGLTEDGDEIRAGPDLLPGQEDHGTTRHPGAVHLGDAAVVSQGRRERRGVHSGNEAEVVRVAQGEVHVAGMRALHPLGHPGGPAGVEDGGEALSRVVQPGWRRAAGLRPGQGQHIERRQVAEGVLSARQDDDRRASSSMWSSARRATWCRETSRSRPP